jgi:hypothetical protein
MGIVQPGMIILGSFLSSFVIRALGPIYAASIGLSFTASGLAIAGLGAYAHNLAPFLWWGGHGVVAGLGQGLTMPCLCGIWSRRVGPSDQGKLFAISSLTMGIGSSLGTFVFSNFLFNNGASDSPTKLARGWMIGSMLHIVVLVLNVLAYRSHVLPGRFRPRRALASIPP